MSPWRRGNESSRTTCQAGCLATHPRGLVVRGLTDNKKYVCHYTYIYILLVFMEPWNPVHAGKTAVTLPVTSLTPRAKTLPRFL